MNEYMPAPQDIIRSIQKEKFPDSQEILDVLENGTVVRIVDIDSVRPELAGKHQNEVQLADIKRDHIPEHINKTFGVVLQSGEKVVQGIFKPTYGENKEVKAALHIHDCYLREVAGYDVDAHFGFNLVPPTVVKEINGSTGSLQLYIQPDIADSYALLSDIVDFDTIARGEDGYKMAVFDYVTANWERKPDNFLVNRQSHTTLYAIDHGFSFYSQSVDAFEKRGPRLKLTHDNVTDKPVITHLSPEIITMLTKGLEKEKHLREQLRPLLPSFEVDKLFERVRALISKKIIL